MTGGYTRNNQAGNPPAQNPAGATTAQGASVQAGNPAPANAQPTNALASSTKFKYRQLDKIDGEPTYPKLVEPPRQMTRNARAVKSLFGRGKHGHKSLVLRDATYVQRAGVSFVVPASKGAYPTFAMGASEDEKKIAIAEFIVSGSLPALQPSLSIFLTQKKMLRIYML